VSAEPSPERRLAELLAASERGPRRNAVFVLWLLARLARDLIASPLPSERNQRRRVAAFRARLGTLTLPAPLRRRILAVIQEEDLAAAPRAIPALTALVPAVRETLGAEPAAILERQIATLVPAAGGPATQTPPGTLSATTDR